MPESPVRKFASGICTAVFAAALAAVAGAEPAVLAPEWVTRVPLGGSLSAGAAGLAVDSEGVSYITGIAGPSSNTDITTTAIGPDGSLLWSRTFNGPGDWHDQVRGLTLGADGVLYVVGNTPGPGSFAQVLVLAYDTTTGDLLRSIQYSSGPGRSEHGASVAVNAAGRIFVAGGTVGDGGDGLVVALDPEGNVAWQRTWDGPAWGPYSQDNAIEVLLAPDGDPVVLIHGVMASNHPDYVVVKYAAATGGTVWQASWGVNGGDYPSDMEIDAQGDVYVTGTGIDWIDKFSTIRVRGSDGAVLWQAYDSVANDHSAAALALDGRGGVFLTGSADPEGNHSNFNDDIFTVKRDAAGGTLLWAHRYGDPCVGCYDIASDVIIDPAGHVFVAGSTSSPPYSSDAILLVLDTDTGLETDRGIIAGPAGEGASSRELRFAADYSLRVSGHMSNFDTGGVDMTVAKYASMAEGGGVSCGDVLSFTARCVNPPSSAAILEARLVLRDASHHGIPVTITLDGKPQVVTIQGAEATMVLGGAVPGPHAVELIDPPGCAPVVPVTCAAASPGSAFAPRRR